MCRAIPRDSCPGIYPGALAPGLAPGPFEPGLVARLVDKCRAGNAVGFADNMAFVTVLSTQMLHHQMKRAAQGRPARL